MNLKGKVLEAILEHQKEIVVDLETILKRQKDDADIDEEATKDVEDFARQDSSAELIKSIEVQLSQARNDLNVLEKLDSSPKEIVEVGALVQTDVHKVLIGVASTPVEVDGEKYYGITQQAPIYFFMQGKKVGDKFKFGNKHFEIKSIS